MARDAELRARITAKDDASKVIDKVAAKADDLEDRPVEVEVDAEVSSALSALDQVAAEAKQTAEAAEALGRALGPELAAKADTTAIVGDLRQMGLSIDQIKGNADELAAKMRELADADVGGKLGSSLGTARGQIEDLGKSADSSKSVLANMVGNSAQDVAELGGVAGSAGVAIGQMGEYMADAAAGGDKFGQIVKNFGAVAAPIAAITVAVSAIGSIFKAAGDRAARAKAQVQAFTGALSDVDQATAAVEGLADSMTAFDADARTAWGGFVEGVAGAVKSLPLVGGLVGDAGQNISNVIPVFNQLSITARDIGEAAEAGGSAWDNLQAKLYAAQVGAHITSDEYSAASQVLYGFRDSAEAAAVMTEFFGKAADEGGKDSGFFADNLEDVVGGFEDVDDSGRHARDSIANVQSAFEKLTGRIDAKRSVLDLRDQFDRLAESGEAAWDKAVAGEADAEAAQRSYQRELLDTQSMVADYAAQVGGIPDDAITRIVADVDNGSIRDAEELLRRLTKEREAVIRVRMIASQVTGSSGGGNAPIPAAAGVGAQAVVPITFDLGSVPTAAQISRKIGPIRLPFAVASSLRADERLSGTRDL